MRKKKFIVKVQLAIMGDDDVLIYNEDKTVMEQFPRPRGLKTMMKGKIKQFFYAYTDKNKMLVLDRLAPWQDW